MGRGSGRIQALLRDGSGKRRAWAAPIPWIVGVAGATALGIGGLLGGLAPIEETIVTGDESTVVDAGVATIGVERALIFDEANELNIDLAADEDLLVLRVRVTSTFDEPIFAGSILATTVQADPLSVTDEDRSAEVQMLRIPGLATRPILVMRLDTSETPSVVLQPDVPTTLAVGFVIPARTDLSELTVRIDKITTFQFAFLGDGEDHGYESAGHLATITVPVSRDELTP